MQTPGPLHHPLAPRPSSPFQQAQATHAEPHIHGLSHLGPGVTGQFASGTSGYTQVAGDPLLTIAPLDIKGSELAELDLGLNSGSLPGGDLFLPPPEGNGSMMALLGSLGSLSGGYLQFLNQNGSSSSSGELTMTAGPQPANGAEWNNPLQGAHNHPAAAAQPTQVALDHTSRGLGSGLIPQTLSNGRSSMSPNGVSTSTTVRPLETPGSTAAAAAAFAASFNWQQEVSQATAAAAAGGGGGMFAQPSMAAAGMVSRGDSLAGGFLNGMRLSSTWSGDLEGQLPINLLTCESLPAGCSAVSSTPAGAAGMPTAGSTVRLLQGASMRDAAAALQPHIPSGFTGDLQMHVLLQLVPPSHNRINCNGNAPHNLQNQQGSTPLGPSQGLLPSHRPGNALSNQQFAGVPNANTGFQVEQGLLGLSGLSTFNAPMVASQLHYYQQQQQQNLQHYNLQQMQQCANTGSVPNTGLTILPQPDYSPAAAVGATPTRKHMEHSKQKPNNKIPAAWASNQDLGTLSSSQGYVRAQSPSLDAPGFSNPTASHLQSPGVAGGQAMISPNMAQSAPTIQESYMIEALIQPEPEDGVAQPFEQSIAEKGGDSAGTGADKGLRRRAAAVRSRQYLHQHAVTGGFAASRSTSQGSGHAAGSSGAKSGGSKRGRAANPAGSRRKNAANSRRVADGSAGADDNDGAASNDDSAGRAKKRHPVAAASSSANLAAGATSGSAGSAEGGQPSGGHTNTGGAVGHSSTSHYKGVTKHRWTLKWEAHLWDAHAPRKPAGTGGRTRGKQVYLGGFNSELEAARAYDRAALAYWGDTAKTNFATTDYAAEVEWLFSTPKDFVVSELRKGSTGFARGASKYRGVTRHHQAGKWEARIGKMKGNKYTYLGIFDSEEDAARAYDMEVVKHKGDKAITNFPITDYLSAIAGAAMTPTTAAAEAADDAAAADEEQDSEDEHEEDMEAY